MSIFGIGRSGLGGLSCVAAHRGLSGLAPESTSVAYQAAGQALKAAAAAKPDLRRTVVLEGDVHLSKDGELFFNHDRRLDRTTDVQDRFPDKRNATVGDLTSAQLKTLDAGSWFNDQHPDLARSQFVGQRLLTADEFFTHVEQTDDPALDKDGKTGAYIELKDPSRYPGVEEKLVQKLKARGWLDAEGRPTRPLYVQSFDIESLQKLQDLAPELPRVFLSLGVAWDTALELAKQVDAVAIGPMAALVMPWRVRAAHGEGIAVHPHTVDSPVQMKLLAAMGVDGFFTNRVDRYLSAAGLPVPRADDLFEPRS